MSVEEKHASSSSVEDGTDDTLVSLWSGLQPASL